MTSSTFHLSRLRCFWIALILLVSVICVPHVAQSQVMTFEDGIDGHAIESDIPGMEFKTTAGYDWIYGDKTTGKYNVYPYGGGMYWCNGNFFAWLGPNQGYGRIDFEEGTVSNITVGYSSYSNTYLDAYDAEGNLLQRATGSGNLNTRRLDYFTVDASGIAYVIVHDTGNYWLIDDLEVTPENVEILRIDANESDNEKAHHTNKFGDPFVIRRGQSEQSQGQDSRFDVVVAVSSNYDPGYYDLSFEAKLKTGTTEKVFLIPSETTTIDDDKWGARRTDVKEKGWLPFFEFDDYKAVFFEINIPFNAPVGEYEFKALLTSGSNRLDEKEFEKPVIVLFNPWCEDDPVGLAGLSGAEKNEYVLSENGRIWTGSASDHSSSAWAFDQFDEASLYIAVHALRHANATQLSSSVQVARILSERVNSNNGGDILRGLWGNPPPYQAEADSLGRGDDWTSATSWSGSDEILAKYNSYGYSQPVLFGQCWVFGGVLNSVCRSLGVPTRVVTTFDSIHEHIDRNGIAEIQVYQDENGDWKTWAYEPWNFHVWNESWMARSDRVNCDGWQAIDATPQELSDGKYQMGPTPLVAVKNDWGGNYDVWFVREETQDKPLHYLVGHIDANGSFVHDRTVPSQDDVQPTVVTKAVNSNNPNWVTSQYKTIGNPNQPGNPLHISTQGGFIAGQSLEWDVRVVNSTSEDVEYVLKTTVHSVTNRGDVISAIASETITVQLVPGQSEEISVSVYPDAYFPALHYSPLFECLGVIELDGEPIELKRSVASVVDPNLQIEVIPSSSVDVGDTVTLEARFVNAFSYYLSNGRISLKLPSELECNEDTVVDIGDLEPNETVVQTFTVQALRGGQHKAIVTFNCDEMGAITTVADVAVALPAQLVGTVSGPDRCILGTPVDLNVLVENNGHYAGAGTVTVYPPSDMDFQGDISRNLGEIAAGDNNSLTFTFVPSGEGAFAIPFVIEGADGDDTQIIHYMSVYSYQHSVSISAAVETVSGDVDSTVILSITNGGSEVDSVEVRRYASTATLDFDLFDGTTRIVGQPISVPANGVKQLQLHIKGTGYAGEIVVTASSLLDPDAADRITITVMGEETPSPPGNLQATLDNGNVILTWQPSPEQSVTSYIVFRKGPGEYTFTEYGASPCCSFEDASVEAGGTYSYRLRAVTAGGLESEGTDAVSVSIPDEVPGDLDGDSDVDRDDLNIILSHRNQPAGVCPECDLDGDGMITALDARKLVTMCTRLRCACE